MTKRHETLALVLAGGQGSRMDVLTKKRAKPAMPVAGVYRLIDVPLSNLRNSHISQVWVIAQYETQSIIDILANGRPWDLDRMYGGLRVITPEQSAEDDGTWHEGNADAIYQARDLIREAAPDVLLVLSADHLYRMDYRDAIDQHLKRGSDVTIVTTEMPLDQASNHAVLSYDDDLRVTAFDYKPDDPESTTVATEVFVYSTDVVLETLQKLADEEGQLEDFGHQLLPYLVENGTVHAFPLEGYWRDLGRPETYFAAHMDLLDEHPELSLDDPAWPIFTLGHQRMPARIADTASVETSLISPGCRVAGTVERSVLGAGVVVEEGATVRDAVILRDVTIKSGAEVQYAIIDRDVVVDSGAKVVGTCSGESPSDDDLVLVGMGAVIDAGREVAAGERIEPQPDRAGVAGRGMSLGGTTVG